MSDMKGKADIGARREDSVPDPKQTLATQS